VKGRREGRGSEKGGKPRRLGKKIGGIGKERVYGEGEGGTLRSYVCVAELPVKWKNRNGRRMLVKKKLSTVFEVCILVVFSQIFYVRGVIGIKNNFNMNHFKNSFV
jgi:hypothetical protein